MSLSWQKAASLALLAFLALVVASCGDDEAERMRQEQQRKAEAELQAFLDRHDATLEWRRSLPNEPLGRIFTIELQRLLVDPNRPVAAPVALADIARRGTSYTATFEPALLDWSGIHFTLRLTRELADSLLSTATGRSMDIYGNYMVAARIDTIVRPRFRVNAVGQLEVELDQPSTLVGRGELLGFKHLPNRSFE